MGWVLDKLVEASQPQLLRKWAGSALLVRPSRKMMTRNMLGKSSEPRRVSLQMNSSAKAPSTPMHNPKRKPDYRDLREPHPSHPMHILEDPRRRMLERISSANLVLLQVMIWRTLLKFWVREPPNCR